MKQFIWPMLMVLMLLQITIWIRSIWFVSDTFFWTDKGTQILVHFAFGRVWIEEQRSIQPSVHFEPLGFGHRINAPPTYIDMNRGSSGDKFGVAVATGNGGGAIEVQKIIGFPLSVPVFAILLLLLLKWLRFARRNRDGKCLKCGYDLRGSMDRCPECGTCFTREKIRGHS